LSKKTNGRQFVVCSDRTVEQMQAMVPSLFKANKYVIFSWTYGDTATLPQKALIHIWLKTWAAFALHKREEDVTKQEMEGMKRSVKARYYHETGAAFMVEEIFDPLAPTKRRLEYTSIADWSPADCYHVMTWMQGQAAQNGLVLEAVGEYQSNCRQANE
jgi:hypothetical protein